MTFIPNTTALKGSTLLNCEEFAFLTGKSLRTISRRIAETGFDLVEHDGRRRLSVVPAFKVLTPELCLPTAIRDLSNEEAWFLEAIADIVATVPYVRDVNSTMYSNAPLMAMVLRGDLPYNTGHFVLKGRTGGTDFTLAVGANAFANTTHFYLRHWEDSSPKGKFLASDDGHLLYRPGGEDLGRHPSGLIVAVEFLREAVKAGAVYSIGKILSPNWAKFDSAIDDSYADEAILAHMLETL